MTEMLLPDVLPSKFARIHIELTNHCNFSCVFCPDSIMRRPRGFMELKMAMSILDQIAELNIAEKVTFHVMGEPLLHPNFFEIADYAHSLNLKVGLTTNGGLLNEKTITRLASRDFHQIDISLQTPDAGSFSATRGTKMDFDKYQQNLMKLLLACNQRERPPIFKIRIMTTKFAASLREKLGIPKFLADSHSLRQTIYTWTERVTRELGLKIDDAKVKRKLSAINIYAWNVIEIAPKVFIETYVLTDWGNSFSNDRVIPANHGYCFGMRDHFAILRTGEVTLCCVDYEGKTSLGNVGAEKLVDILRSEESIRIVGEFQRGRLAHDHCKECLGSHSKMASWTKPALSYLGLKILKPFFYRKYNLTK